MDRTRSRGPSSTLTDLGTFASTYSEAFGVNASGQVVGEGCVNPTCFVHGLLWDGGAPVDLGTLVGGDASHARGINDDGTIIGDSEISSGGDSHAVTWDSGGIHDLGTLPDDTYSNGVAINAGGHATGRSGGRPGGGSYSFFWDGSAMSEIPLMPGGSFLNTAALNASDQVVGLGDVYGGDQTAFLWESSTGQTIDLNTLLPSGSGWQLATATGINDDGQIVGYGYRGGHLRGFLMSPSVDPAPTDIAGAVVPAGVSLSTDTGGPGTTPADPLATTVTSPVGGLVTIREGVNDVNLGAGFAVLGSQIRILAPHATATDPLHITFAFDASIVPAGEDASTVQIFRDTDQAAPCTGSAAADPDPCVLDRTDLPDGGVQITVLTSHASAWSGAVVSAPPTFPFSGFFSPLKNPPAMNRAKPGSVVPVRFGLGGDRGLAIFDRGFPQMRRIDCATRTVIESPVPTVGTLVYNPRPARYRYRWKTSASLARTCQRITLELTDGTQHDVDVRFTRPTG